MAGELFSPEQMAGAGGVLSSGEDDNPPPPDTSGLTSAQRMRQTERTATPPVDVKAVGEATPSREFDVAHPSPEKADPEDPLAGFYTVEPDATQQIGEQAKTFVKAAGGGGIESSGIIPGISLGVKAGGTTGHPYGRLAGGFVGLGAALIAGHMAAEEAENQGWVIADPLKVERSERMAAVAGQSFGSSLVPTGQVQAIAKTGVRMGDSIVGSMVNRVLAMARENPKLFAAGEASSAVSAAVAAAGTEAVLPGNIPARTTAEMTAGFLNPVRRMIDLGLSTYNPIKRLIARMTPQGRQTAAAKQLQEFLENAEAHGTSPEEKADFLLRQLHAAKQNRIGIFENPDLGTAGQITGDPRLAALEAELGRLDEKFWGNTIMENSRKINEALDAAVFMLRHSGDPESLKAIAEIRAFRYDNLLNRAMDNARAEATLLAEKAGGTQMLADAAEAGNDALHGATRSELSLKMKEVYERVIGRAREVETHLWGKVFADHPDITVEPRSFKKVYDQLAFEQLSGNDMPAPIQKAINTLMQASNLMTRVSKGVTTLPDGTKITKKMIAAAKQELSPEKAAINRSQLLAYARGQHRTTDPLSDRMERVYGQLAEAILNDMTRAGLATKQTASGARRGVGGRMTSYLTPYDEAVEFTRQFNNTMDKTFMGSMTLEGSHGLRTAPEAMMNKFFAAGDAMVVARMKELHDIADNPAVRLNLNPMLIKDHDFDAKQMYDISGRFMRTFVDAATDVVTDTVTGTAYKQLNLTKAQRFLQDNAETLEFFPHIKRDLEAAVTGEEQFKSMTAKMTGIQRDRGKSLLAGLIKHENVHDVVAGIMRSANPQEQFAKLATLAKSGGAETIDGLNRAIWDYAFQAARGRGDHVDPQALIEALTLTRRPGTPSLMDMMLEHNLVPPERLEQITRFTEILGNLNIAMSARAVGEAVLDQADTLTVVGVRIMGSVGGREALKAVPGGTGQGATGSTLIAAQRGAQAAFELLERSPGVKVMTLLQDALSGAPLKDGGQPWSLLEHLLKKNVSIQQVHEDMLSLHAYMWTAGLLGATDEYYGEEGPVDSPLSGAPIEPPFAGLSRPQFRVEETGQGLPDHGVGLRKPGEASQEAEIAPDPGAQPAQEADPALSGAPVAPGAEIAPQQAPAVDPNDPLGGFYDPAAATDPEGEPVEEEGEEEEIGGPAEAQGLDLTAVAQQVAPYENRQDDPNGGWDDAKQVWLPHPSVEGGRDTLAYGHKLSAAEEMSGIINVGGQRVEFAREGLTDEQAQQLLMEDLGEAEANAREVVPVFDNLPEMAQSILVQMAFQMGEKGLKGFKKATAALSQNPPDFITAAKEMLNSDWAKQTSRRAGELAAQMQGIQQ